MITLPGFSIRTKIYESSKTLVYWGVRDSDNQKLFFKVLNNDYPTPQEIERYETEYKILQFLQINGTPRVFGLKNYQNTLVIILEDFGGESLSNLLDEQSFSLQEFLEIAIKITDVLEQIHSKKVIHKDINPSNIVFNPKNKILKIIDFGLATQVSRETPIVKDINLLEGTLAYISPEQTGRTNHFLDYRTDFYSLGITFYELLTKKLPFQETDILNLVHSHLAKQPNLPSSINSNIPEAIDNIIMKLMAKSPEERYQSCQGIKADLKFCLEQLQKTGAIEKFVLGTKDISYKFQISQKLYGREKEIDTLLAAFDRSVFSQRELMLISGASGIGKTALVEEITQKYSDKEGYFIYGKFDQFHKNNPYSAFIVAFQQLIKCLLQANKEKLDQCKQELLTALGNNGQVVIDIIPELELIIGKQSSLAKIEETETENRFNLVFQKFIQVFAKPQQPLTIFLDDLQWADGASLKLLKILMKEKSSGLFVIATCRDQDSSLSTHLRAALEEIQINGGILNQIYLDCLQLEDITKLVADSFRCSLGKATDLAKLILLKTGGNPFFITQFIKILYAEHLINFNSKIIAWEWDKEKIENQGITENVVDFLLDKIQKMPENTQEILKLASCMGSEFDLSILSENRELYLADMKNSLQVAIAEGLVIPLEDYSLNKYKFVHDRIREAANSFLEEQERIGTHYQIGKILLQIFGDSLDSQIFIIVNQLNHGHQLIDNQEEKDQLAQLNLLACHKAGEISAFENALEYATIAISLLQENPWQRQYEMTLELHELGAEFALLCGQIDRMEQWINAVIDYGKIPLDRLKVYLIKIQFLTSQGLFWDAIALGRIIFKELGVEFPEHPTVEDIHQAVREVNTLMTGRTIEQLLELPVMLNPEKRAIMEIAKRIIPACYLGNSPLFPLVSSLQVRLSIEYGNSPVSATGYADYGIVLINFFKDIAKGTEFGTLAYLLASSAKDKSICAVTFVPIGLYLYHHQFHLRETLDIFQKGLRAAFEIGKLEYVGHNSHGYSLNSYWCGQPLTEIEPKICSYIQIAREFNLLTTVNYCSILWETIICLQGNPKEIEIAFEEINSEQKLIAQSLTANDVTRLFYFYLHRAVLRFLLGNLTGARGDAVRAREYIAGGLATIGEAGLFFYDSLITLALPEWGESVTQRQQIQENQAQLQLWADYAPMNYLHKWQLVEAERCRVLGEKLEAIELYDQAISGAKENGYLQEEALANELAAKFYLAWGKQTIARAYMKEARYCYLKWGATAKIRQLDEQYPQLLKSPERVSASSGSKISTLDSSSYQIVNLDLTTMIKSSQAIASEMILENLVQTLMGILLQNSGAQSGCLLFCSTSEGGNDCTIVATGNAQGISGIPSEEYCLPESVLNYVTRTLEGVVLSNASREGDFVTDPYIQSVKPLSLLCYPLVNQGQLVGIVYLENNLTVGAFTEEQVEFLQVISGQAAIAITNAKLYTQVRENEQTLQQFLEAIPVAIGILDKNGQPYYVNQTAKILLGKGLDPKASPESLAEIYQNYIAGTNKLYPNDQLPIVRALNGQVCHIDDLEIHQGDKIIPVEAWGTPIYGESGSVDYAIVVFQDITERKQTEKILTDYSHTLEKQVAERTAELIHANQQLSRLAILDGLTQIPNRRRFDEYITTEWQRHCREKQSLALILVDIDYFKLYNDYYGHQGGDKCLVRVAKTMAKVPQRPADLAARYGGEEFAVILPDTDTEGGLVVAQSIRKAIASLAIPHAKSEVGQYVTLSLGIASLIPSPEINHQALITRADEALYQAKQQGRNRAIAYS